MGFTLAVSLFAYLTVLPVFSSEDFLDNNPALEDYQNDERCLPFSETWYMLYRNFATDPNYGDNTTCITVTETGPYVNGTTTVRVQYSPNGSEDLIAKMMSTPGYDVYNSFNFVSANDPSISINFIVAYTDCENCKVFRHSYIESGRGCSYWVPESKLGVNNTCCEFIYDLLCGPSPKYQIYRDCNNTA